MLDFRVLDPPLPQLADAFVDAPVERPQSVQVGYARIDCLSFPQAVEKICALAGSDRWSQLVVTPNIQHVVELNRNPAFRQAYDSASMTLPDGWPVAAAARWAGVPGQARVTGADLLPAVCEAARDEGLSVGFMGGQPGAAALCAERLQAQLPGLEVTFLHEAPIGFDSDDVTLRGLLDELEDKRPSILFLGLGAPKQEIFAHRHLPRANVVVGVGAAIDFQAGLRRRAPGIVQRAGLEWLYRIGTEPRRLWRRYAHAAPVFLWLMLRSNAPTSAVSHETVPA